MDEDIKGNDAIEMPANASRRTFIKGIICSGATAFSAGYLFRASLGVPELLAQAAISERLLTLHVNRQQRRVDASKQETLAWTLRYKLGLTGTKLGCDRAECGACTVLIDDIPRYSCSALTHTVRGGKVQTIEGLANADGTLHPVQRAVVDEQGFQCAFCFAVVPDRCFSPAKNQIPAEFVLPEVLQGDSLSLEGEELRVVHLGRTDTANTIRKRKTN